MTVLRPDKNGERGLWINRNAGRNLWRKNVWLLGLITALAFGVSVYAQDRDDYGERWVYLGSRRVDGHRDHDVIRVGMRDGKFRAVQLRVSGGAVDFHRVIVHFGNGTSEEIAFRERIPDGGRTRPIDLPGDRRIIRSVEMWYGKESWHRLPKVEVFGIR
jgi:hypothetical protein